MRYIFIDCGAHLGQSIDAFRKTKIYQRFNWEIYSFECVPELFALLSEKYKHQIGIELFDRAVTDTDNRLVDFYLTTSRYPSDKNLWGSSTIIKSKKTGNLDKNNPIKVSTIDLSRFITQNFKKQDTIYLKMDIEGAEYHVLEKMFKDGTIDYIDKLFIEFHHTKIGLSSDVHNQLVYRLKQKSYLEMIVEQPGHTPGYWFNDL